MASINNKVLVIIACILALLGWIVALAGVAKLNDICNDEVDTYSKNYYGNSGYNGRGHRDCSDGYRWEWWAIWFCFFLTIVVLIMTVLGAAASWAATLQIFCAICVGVTMLAAHDSYFFNYNAGQAALAGFLIASIALFLLIIFLGMGSAGVNVSVSVAANKTAPDPDRVEKVSPQPKGQPKGVDNA